MIRQTFRAIARRLAHFMPTYHWGDHHTEPTPTKEPGPRGKMTPTARTLRKRRRQMARASRRANRDN